MDFDWKPNRKEMLLSVLGVPVPLNVSVITRVALGNRFLLLFLIAVFVVSNFFDSLPFAFIPNQALRKNALTWISSFFIHGSLVHLLGNCYFLRIFGNLLEVEKGARELLAVVFVSALFGNLFVYIFSSNQSIPHLGSSGGVLGVMTYVLLSFPRQYYGIFFLGDWIKIPSIFLMAFYIVYQFFGSFFEVKGLTEVSYICHLGGIVAGALLWRFLK